MDDRLIMGVLDFSSDVNVFRAAKPAKNIVAYDAEVTALASDLSFNVIIDKGTGLLHSRNRFDAVMKKFGHGRLFVEGAAFMAFHHPEIGAGDIYNRQTFKNIAAIKSIHGQNDRKQQTYADYI